MASLSVFADLVASLADLLDPLFHDSATAAAIVVFTALVRLLVLPLSLAAARGQRARARLAPQVAALRTKHRKDPAALQRALTALHAEHQVSPLSGCLPSLLQLPAFFLLYHLFSSGSIGGEPNALLGHTLLGVPLGGRWHQALAEGGPFGAPGLVYLALFLLVAAVATANLRRTRRGMAASGPLLPTGEDGRPAPGLGALTRVLPLMSFLTLISVAVLPLAAALYVVTSTTWSAVERAVLYREREREQPEARAEGAAA
ncbi:YidC/Oxa1 family membrane protein insertase [Streptomyces sp. SCSIO ZS0520]|uniref:YidC/Oxa1 family membrane protein insertase n=1 Tax=Streptomyces sp. SCSIO ZS0520 TaxID=2892996 RepID=UPI0021D95B76|nr:YidC/Oxa1 family membrane protein insertase [Streptomyces sp. SCSIO ZS0520]